MVNYLVLPVYTVKPVYLFNCVPVITVKDCPTTFNMNP